MNLSSRNRILPLVIAIVAEACAGESTPATGAKATGPTAPSADLRGWLPGDQITELARFRQQGGVFAAAHPLHSVRASLAGADVAAQVAGGAPVVLHVRGWGPPSAQRAFAPTLTWGGCDSSGRATEAGGCARAVEGSDAGMRVTWENRVDGLEQTFVVNTPSDPLVIDLEVGATVELDADGALLMAADGSALRYDHLAAWDADGKALAARMESAPGGIRLRVDTAGARWPVTVDPLLSDPSWSHADTEYDHNEGSSTAQIGDVNGDGRADIAVGAPATSGYYTAGAVKVWYNGALGFGAAPSWEYEADLAETSFGASVDGAGDVNGDGFDDLIVGEPSWTTCEDYWDTGCISTRGRVVVFAGSAAGLSAAPVWTQEADREGDGFGAAVAGIGDVNGDGFDDVAIGAPGAGTSDEGRVYVYYGSAAGPATTASWRWETNVASTRVGGAITSGDANGDGYADMVVGSEAEVYGYSNGRVDAFFGSPLGFAAAANMTLLGSQQGAAFGAALDLDGDVDGDGFDDLVVGARGFNDGTLYDAGMVALYRGGALGLRSTASWSVAGDTTYASLGAAVLLSDTDGDGYDDIVVGAPGAGPSGAGLVFTYPGGPGALGGTPSVVRAPASAGEFGASLSDLGDLGGDGRSEVLVGDPAFTGGWNSDAGAVWIFAGADGTVDGDGDGVALATDCDDGDATAYPGATEVVANGHDEDCDFGELCWHDADDDGYRPPGHGTIASVDLDCTDYDEGSNAEPATDCDDGDYYIRPGGQEYVDDGEDSNCDGQELCLADRDHDGFIQGTATTLSDDLDCQDGGEGRKGAGWTWTSTDSYDSVGASLAVGDVNADGWDDLVVGAPDSDGSGYQSGKLMLFLGSPTGPVLATWSPMGTYYGRLGAAVVVADFNSDGTDDIAAGEPGYASGGLTTGRVLVWSGRAGVEPASSAGRTLTGSTTSMFGFSLAAADFSGDGFEDLVVGAPDDNTGASSAGSASLYLGATGGISGAARSTLRGLSAYDDFGARVASAGDVDGDGAADLLVGVPGRDDVVSSGGEVRLHMGGATGFDSVPSWSLDGTVSGGYLGYELAGGDLDGDGFSDVVVGDPSWSDPANYSRDGRVLVYGGAAEGLSDARRTEITSTAVGWDSYGSEVDVSGDLDQDGFLDLVVLGRISYNGDNVAVHAGSPTGVHTHISYSDGVFGASELGPSGVFGPGTGRAVTLGAPSAYAANVQTATLRQIAWDCDDDEPSVSPAAAEIADDGLDQDCDGADSCYADRDGDGARAATGVHGPGQDLLCSRLGEASAAAPVDCDDGDVAVLPGALERPSDGLDQDCDGAELCFADADGDGQRAVSLDVTASPNLDCVDAGEAQASAAPTDCDDGNAAIGLAFVEVASDGIDQDCDGGDLCYVNADGDAFRTEATVVSAGLTCDGPGEARGDLPAGDCDDSNPDRWPGAAEIPDDGIDQDCDGGEVCFTDEDDDGVRTDLLVLSANLSCGDVGEGRADVRSGDCDDHDALVHPVALDVAGDGVDSDCDGIELCFIDADGDGHGGLGTVVSLDGDCDDAGEAAPGLVMDDCDDSVAAVFPGAVEEVSDGVDQDCDGDELCFVDADDDGHRPDSGATQASADQDCNDLGEADLGDPADDCDDADLSAYAGATEVRGDGIDQDCDGGDLPALTVDTDDAGCGCNQGAGGASWVVLAGLAALRRRRASSI